MPASVDAIIAASALAKILFLQQLIVIGD